MTGETKGIKLTNNQKLKPTRKHVQIQIQYIYIYMKILRKQK